MKKLFVLAFALMLSLFSSAYTADANPADGGQFVGQWQNALNTVAEDGFGARYTFSSDGTFIYGNDETGEFDNLLYKAGTWSVVNNELKLEVNTSWVIPTGNPALIAPSEGMAILENGLLRITDKPAEVETYSISSTGKDAVSGRDTISINNITFYNFNDQSDLFKEFKEPPGEALPGSFDQK